MVDGERRELTIVALEVTSVMERPTDAALSVFVTEHYDRLLRLARLVCRDATEAADAVQVGLEQAWRRRSTLRDDAPIKPWLDRIVVREAVRLSRGRQSWLGRLFSPRPGVTWIEAAEAAVPAASEPSTRVVLRAAYQRLSGEQRAVVALHLHLGYSIAETATIVGAPDETVRSRLRVAKARLRRELEEARP
jgi:RNA polymerase sigma-70 factor (ECF subfamily)